MTDGKRAERAFRALHAKYETEDMQAAIVDLSSDLLHLADQYGIEQDYLQRVSLSHYRAETVSTR